MQLNAVFGGRRRRRDITVMIRKIGTAIGAAVVGLAAWALAAVVFATASFFLLPIFFPGADADHGWFPGFVLGCLVGAPLGGSVAGLSIPLSLVRIGGSFLWVANPALWLSVIVILWMLVNGPAVGVFVITLPGAVLTGVAQLALSWAASRKVETSRVVSLS
jgi:hypothetical protein